MLDSTSHGWFCESCNRWVFFSPNHWLSFSFNMKQCKLLFDTIINLHTGYIFRVSYFSWTEYVIFSMCRFIEHALKEKSYHYSIILSSQHCTLLFRCVLNKHLNINSNISKSRVQGYLNCKKSCATFCSTNRAGKCEISWTSHIYVLK